MDVEGYKWDVVSGLENSIDKFHMGIIVEWELNYKIFQVNR